MASKCKSHDHSKGGKGGMPKFPKNIFYFTLVHLSTSVISTYYVSLYYPRTIPQDYPEYHFEFHFTIYFICWFLCIVNLILSRVKNSGRSINTENPSDEKCDRCQISRTERSHHCSTCKQCVSRMDHHCTWVSNCIGLNNHKNFFWYTFYTAVGGSYHMYLVFCYTFSDYQPAYTGFLIKILYFYHSFIVLVFSYFCYTLLNIQWRLIWNGNTNMEYMKEMGMSFAFLYCSVFKIVFDI